MTEDRTEDIRRSMASELDAKAFARRGLEHLHGQVWDTDELCRDFEVLGFSAPFVVARRKSDNKKGSLEFTHDPRFYFDWKEA